MKKPIMIVILILFLTIGFASVSTTLLMNGEIGIASKKSDFNVIFTSTEVKDNSEVTAVISENKKELTFETSKLSAVGNKAQLIYKVKNDSTQYDANVNVVCNYDNTSLNVTGEFSGRNLSEKELMSAQEVRMGSINVELKKQTSSNVTCTLNVDGEERESIVEKSICEYPNGYTWDIEYTKSEHEFKIPCDGEYKLELWGASVKTFSIGAYTSGNIIFNKDKQLYVHIGGEGNIANSSTEGGYNGGGNSTKNSLAHSGYTGGGATDIRITSGIWNNTDSLRSRIMVAAGGSTGGSAGGLVGYQGSYIYFGKFGTQTEGGSIPPQCSSTSGDADCSTCIGTTNGTAGGFGYGGNGGMNSASYNGESGGSGGGGGYYGGSGASGICSGSAPGGGGSSFISGHTGCVAITSSTNQSPKSGCTTGTSNNNCSIHYSGYVFNDTKMIDGKGYSWRNVKGSQEQMPNPNGGYYNLGQGHTGNGHARITLISAT